MSKQPHNQNCIVCATRGGEASRAVQMEAIKQAKLQGKPLVFLYVTNPASLGELDSSLMAAVREELNWMGQALLHIASLRARAAGIQAQLVVREGDVREEIVSFLRDSESCLLLLGAPRKASFNVFGDDAVEQFAASIREKTGAEVRVIRPVPPERSLPGAEPTIKSLPAPQSEGSSKDKF
ncbi:MAG: universal stress protein [Anaerolineae bacterium]